MNAIYENSTDTDLGSCWGCAVTIAKELPCIYQGIKLSSVSALLDCGVAKSDVSAIDTVLVSAENSSALTSSLSHIQLCHCADCLPDAVQSFVNQFCNAKGKARKPSLKNPTAPAERTPNKTSTSRGSRARFSSRP